MDKTQIRNILKFGIKFVGTSGMVMVGRNFIPIGLSPYGQAACTTALIFAGMAFSEMIDEQLLRCDAVIDKIANGNGEFIVV